MESASPTSSQANLKTSWIPRPKRSAPPLRDAKYCLGYTFFDMPDLKSIRPWQKNKFPDNGLIYPWVQDMRSLAASAAGKQQWISILKNNHTSASKRGKP
jgi:hypothetical protein